VSKNGKIGTIDEFVTIHKDEWLLMEVLELNDLDEPTVGRLLEHSQSREEILTALRGSTLKDLYIMFAGDVPKKGTVVLF